MNEPQPVSPRRRLQALLAIPDSQRTEAEWDELNELEISLAPGNRAGGPDPQQQQMASARRNAAGSGQPRNSSGQPRAPGGQPRQRRAPDGQPRTAEGQPAGNAQPGKKPPRKFHKRPPKATPAE